MTLEGLSMYIVRAIEIGTKVEAGRSRLAMPSCLVVSESLHLKPVEQCATVKVNQMQTWNDTYEVSCRFH